MRAIYDEMCAIGSLMEANQGYQWPDDGLCRWIGTIKKLMDAKKVQVSYSGGKMTAFEGVCMVAK